MPPANHHVLALCEIFLQDSQYIAGVSQFSAVAIIRGPSIAELTINAVPSDIKSKNGAIDQLCVNTIRTLAMDAVQAANSGHPGTPMALAPVVYCLWQRILRFDPSHPIWPNRDRFVLSVGHASMLLYAMLHLSRVRAVNPKYETLGQLSVTLEDIKRFRQLDSKCPGHPEYRWTSGGTWD